MEAIKNTSGIDPRDRAVVERVFGQRREAVGNIGLILETVDDAPSSPPAAGGELPSWCHVLDGLSDEDLAQFDATLNEPERLPPPRLSEGPQPPRHQHAVGCLLADCQAVAARGGPPQVVPGDARPPHVF